MATLLSSRSLTPARVGMIFWADTTEKHGLAVLAYYTKKNNLAVSTLHCFTLVIEN
jgi:hypothetical protein